MFSVPFSTTKQLILHVCVRYVIRPSYILIIKNKIQGRESDHFELGQNRSSVLVHTNSSRETLRVYSALCNCRIHHVTASMTTTDLIIYLEKDVLESVTTIFKLVAFKLCTVYIFQSVLPLLLFGSYPLPILTMHHIGKGGSFGPAA